MTRSTGGGDDDNLYGDTGADTYLFEEGDGADRISEVYEQNVVNTLKFVGSDFSSEHGIKLVITETGSGPKTRSSSATTSTPTQ